MSSQRPPPDTLPEEMTLFITKAKEIASTFFETEAASTQSALIGFSIHFDDSELKKTPSKYITFACRAILKDPADSTPTEIERHARLTCQNNIIKQYRDIRPIQRPRQTILVKIESLADSNFVDSRQT